MSIDAQDNDRVSVNADNRGSDSEYVGCEEVVFRQLGPGGNPPFFDPQSDSPIRQAVFLPSKHDQDGLSFIRQKYRLEIWAAYRSETPTVRYRLISITVQVLSECAIEAGLASFEMKATPDTLDHQYGQPWAHCVACQINREQYDNNREAKVFIKSWARMVSKAVSPSHVQGPFHEPLANKDSYRP